MNDELDHGPLHPEYMIFLPLQCANSKIEQAVSFIMAN